VGTYGDDPVDGQTEGVALGERDPSGGSATTTPGTAAASPMQDCRRTPCYERMTPMTAYLALTHKVADVDKYLGDYVPQVVPLLQKHGIEVLAGHFGATALEGSADSVILLRAESEAAFREFYDDPDYAGPKALRLSITSDQNMVVAPQFTGLSGIRPAEQHAAPPD